VAKFLGNSGKKRTAEEGSGKMVDGERLDNSFLAPGGHAGKYIESRAKTI